MRGSTRDTQRNAAGRLAMIFAAVLFISLQTACGRGSTERQPVVQEWFYENMDAGQRHVYDAFRKAAADPFSTEPSVIMDEDGSPESMAVSGIDRVYQGFMYDHPEMFWLTGSYNYRVCGKTEEDCADAVAVIPSVSSQEELEGMQAQFESAAKEILAATSGNADDGAEALRIFQSLSDDAEYEEEALYDPELAAQHSAYGAIVQKRAVCDGFSLAYKYLLNRRGIQCIVIPGTSEGQAHTWNTAFWDGTWHEADVTLEVCLGENSGKQYFDLTTEEMGRDHLREDSGIAVMIPEASD